jgi:DNA-directed RNA polymerase specialized sigma24 family protein
MMRNHYRDDLFKDILETLREMPELLAQAFILSHYRGLSKKAIARELGVKEETVPTLLDQANRYFYTSVRGMVRLAKTS